MTHEELVVQAQGWLKRQQCSVIISEMASVGEEADAIGFINGISILVECKASRADFLRDKKKPFRIEPCCGMGTYRYYLAPKGMIKTSELPDRWCLLEYDGEKVRETKKHHKYSGEFRFEKSESKENSLLISLIRRIGQNPIIGTSIKCYTYETKNRATCLIDSGLAK